MDKNWIFIEDGLPYEMENVLVTTYEGKVDIGYLCGNVWFLNSLSGIYTSMKNIVAWMPLPLGAQRILENNYEDNK